MSAKPALPERQAKTGVTTTTEIKRSPAFAAGVHDVRTGARPRFDVFDSDWSYERGRAWAFIAPVSMRLIENDGQLNRKAVALLNAARRRGLVI